MLLHNPSTPSRYEFPAASNGVDLFLLWERHLAARESWLEATPTKATLHHRSDGAQRHNLLFRSFSLNGFLI